MHGQKNKVVHITAKGDLCSHRSNTKQKMKVKASKRKTRIMKHKKKNK